MTIKLPNALLSTLEKIESCNIELHTIQDFMETNEDNVFRGMQNMLGARGFRTFWDWAEQRPNKEYNNAAYAGRFDFWMAYKPAYDVCLFWSRSGHLVVPIERKGDKVWAWDLLGGELILGDMTGLMPLFPKTLLETRNAPVAKCLNRLKAPLKLFAIERKQTSKLQEKAFTVQPKATTPIKEEKETTMKNTTKSNLLETNKEMLKTVGMLQAGRASNKVVKEAVSPLVKALFKPTFMQKFAMRVFGIENPADKLLRAKGSDMLCAQIANAIVELRGVEDERVRAVTKNGLFYAGNELANEVPFEEYMDEVIKKIAENADSALSKISKK